MVMRDRIKEKLGDKIKEWNDSSSKRIYLSIDKQDIFKAAEIFIKQLELRFITASAVELPQAFELLYHFSNDPCGEIYTLRFLLEDKANPEIASISPLFPGGEWIESEIWEMFGIKFSGHPNLRKLLLAEDWPQDKYHLRKEK